MINKVILVGRLGADPESRFTNGGRCVCTMSLATSEVRKNDAGEKTEYTEWHRLVTWGKDAENAVKYLSKGSLLYVEGKLQTRKYTDKNGVEKYTTEVVTTLIKYLDSKKDNQNGGQPQQRRAPARNSRPSEAVDDYGSSPFPGEGTDDMPF